LCFPFCSQRLLAKHLLIAQNPIILVLPEVSTSGTSISNLSEQHWQKIATRPWEVRVNQEVWPLLLQILRPHSLGFLCKKSNGRDILWKTLVDGQSALIAMSVKCHSSDSAKKHLQPHMLAKEIKNFEKIFQELHSKDTKYPQFIESSLKDEKYYPSSLLLVIAPHTGPLSSIAGRVILPGSYCIRNKQLEKMNNEAISEPDKKLVGKKRKIPAEAKNSQVKRQRKTKKENEKPKIPAEVKKSQVKRQRKTKKENEKDKIPAEVKKSQVKRQRKSKQENEKVTENKKHERGCFELPSGMHLLILSGDQLSIFLGQPIEDLYKIADTSMNEAVVVQKICDYVAQIGCLSV